MAIIAKPARTNQITFDPVNANAPAEPAATTDVGVLYMVLPLSFLLKTPLQNQGRDEAPRLHHVFLTPAVFASGRSTKLASYRWMRRGCPWRAAARVALAI